MAEPDTRPAAFSATGANAPRPRIFLTMGDPAGIGPELCLRAAAYPAVRDRCQPVVVGSRALLDRVAAHLDLPPAAAVEEPSGLALDADAVVPGRLDPACGLAAVRCIEHAADRCLASAAAGLCTAPINKLAIAAAGIAFPGHTELLAHRCGGADVAMMMYDENLAVVLATCHMALGAVAAQLRPDRIVRCGRLLAEALRRLRASTPRLAVLGFNPHAGEEGLFGDEEARHVIPAIDALRAAGISVDGPLPPDTAFTRAALRRYDGHVCLYHDQGLIPFKTLAFDTGVNVTLGLPIVRTSVDHGTAFDIAWQGRASATSLVHAVDVAARLAAV